MSSFTIFRLISHKCINYNFIFYRSLYYYYHNQYSLQLASRGYLEIIHLTVWYIISVTMSFTVDGNTFNRTLYSSDDGDFEIKYDCRSKFLTFIRSRDTYSNEFVKLSVNTFKILVTLIESPYHTFETKIDQPDGSAHLFNFWGSASFMMRTINGVNKNQLYLPSFIALELYSNSFRIENEIREMDKKLNHYRQLNPLPLDEGKSHNLTDVNGNTSESGVIEDDGKKNRNLNE